MLSAPNTQNILHLFVARARLATMANPERVFTAFATIARFGTLVAFFRWKVIAVLVAEVSLQFFGVFIKGKHNLTF